MSWKRVFKVFCGMILTGIVVITIGVVWSLFPYQLATLRSQKGYEFHITAPKNWEITVPVGLQIRLKETIILPKRSVAFLSIEEIHALKFSLLEMEEGNLIALVEESTPDRIWAVFDVKEPCHSWPFSEIRCQEGTSPQTIEELLLRVQAHTGKRFETIQ